MKKPHRFLTLHQEDCTYRFLPSGDIYAFTSKDFLFNQFHGNPKDGSLNNIYLRIYREGTISFYPLLGIQSQSKIAYSENTVSFSGRVADISYCVLFRPIYHIWFWTVSLTGNGQEADLVYGQDLGVATQAAVVTNELYNSQYLGHSVFKDNGSYVVCSRQNMENNRVFPYLQQGVLGAKAVHYSTDGLQFFGLSSKETGLPEALSGDLCDVNLQYECAYTALQTERFTLKGRKEITFYGMFKENHPEAVTAVEYGEEIQNAYASLQPPGRLTAAASITIKREFGTPFSSLPFSEEEIATRYPARKLTETENGCTFSFFTGDHAHVVTKAKELLTDRPHGTIVITCPDAEKVNTNLISATQYMYGVFGGHIVTGNTNMHKCISTPRGFFGLLRNGGQRLYVRLNGTYRLLNLPGLFEMGMNYSRWIYRLENDVLTITGYAAAQEADYILTVSSEKNIPYDFVLTSQITMAVNEHSHDIACRETENGLRFYSENDVYPHLHYDVVYSKQDFAVSDDRIFFAEGIAFDETFLTLSTESKSRFSVTLRGRMEAEPEDFTPVLYDFETEKKKVLSIYNRYLQEFRLHGSRESKRLEILNETAWWYTHNAMVHFAMPHGLEQPGGAAWGTRDICQGPLEYFLTTRHNCVARDILLNIFSHQSHATREWPQWFMFDRYRMNAGECHGDVVFWPLKGLADYLSATGDSSILYEKVPYDDRPMQQEPLLSHVRLALRNIQETRFIGSTGLLTYAGGDWDDTLQPANEALKEHLVSTWTMALAYQAFSALSGALPENEAALRKELALLAKTVKCAFTDILIQDGVVSGFMDCSGGKCTPLLHPADNKTGIHYRLLPMTRSIIAELVSPAQAKINAEVVQRELKCPDGVRLMDQPAAYRGGVSHLFKRAEQAANVGREVSLQYTHAHIRYIEAMAKLGNPAEAWEALFQINPILLHETVPNARRRQSNMYFSSSDGAFADRYEYAKNFHKLKEGSVEVKGGWRLYSSGPGIYLRQVIGNIFGLRFDKGGLVVDPVLPNSLDGVCLTYRCFDLCHTFLFRVSGAQAVTLEAEGKALPAAQLPNPYRRSALLLAEKDLPRQETTITVYC